jgi:type IV pilus assembly protein PilX
VQGAGRQRGLVLVSSILLLLIITILALSMFRSFGVQERIAGNIREKQRATTAAEEAQQYAEYWLTYGSNASTPAVTCTALLNANLGQGQICSNTLASSGVNPAVPSWTLGGGWAIGAAPVGVQITPPAMTNLVNVNNPSSGTYFQAPSFYIAYLGLCADGVGSCYQIDAVGYGGTYATVSVVESTYEISAGVVNRGGL